MKSLARLTVKTKLIGGFLIVAAVAAIIGVVGLYSTSQVNARATQMYETEIRGLRHTADTRGSIIGAGGAVRSALLASNEQERGENMQNVQRRFSNAYKSLDQVETLFITERGKAAVAQTRVAIEAFEGAAIMAIAQRSEVSAEEARKLGDGALALAEAAEANLHKLVEEKQANAQRLDGEIAEVYANAKLVSIALTIGGALLAVLLGWLITRGLTRQLGGEPADVAGVAASIAQGNLTNRIDVSHAEDGSVIHAINVMQESLRRVVHSVRSSSDSIAAGSGQIAAGNADLSQRTEEQAANLTETAAAMEELSSTVKSNADVAQQAAHLAGSASDAAIKGGEVVNDVVVTMGEINASSRKIVDIIGVIDSIAFQTNILALNAAVEAARAGEQGRGFAVVASEVRSLAQKSAAAAKDIKTLIDDSVARAEAGSQMVDAAGEAMTGIVTQVQHVTDLINEISAATKEQTSGIAQINDAVLQLSDVTQQNAALVEQSASASNSLNEQAKALVDVVGVFQLGQDQDAAFKRASTAHAPTASARLSSARAPANTGGASREPLAASTDKSRLPGGRRLSASANLNPAPSKQALTMGKPEPVREEEWEEF
jgi:methyl-accepting chemotaxis protein